LKEWEHYIPVKRDLSDVIEKTTWCLENYENALIIAENAFQFSKMYLTRQACYDKWNDVICNFTPPKRRFWKVGQTFQSAFSKHFSRV